MGDVQGGSRKRAVGTRDRIMAHLAQVGEVSDHTGKASTLLAATIGYPGSSIAFAQLLTGMERAGLIQREIRGKRTYRIIPGPAAPPPDAVTQPDPAADAVSQATPPPETSRPAAPPPAAAQPAVTPGAATPGAAAPGAGHAAAAEQAAADLSRLAGPGGLDYDELARRLLVQVVQRLTGPDTGRVPAAPAPAQPGQPVPQETVLQETVASLEQKLASATSRQRRLAEENSRLREQLRAAEQGLAEAQERASGEALAGRFDSAEVLLLERLLSPLREERRRSTEADTG